MQRPRGRGLECRGVAWSVGQRRLCNVLMVGQVEGWEVIGWDGRVDALLIGWLWCNRWKCGSVVGSVGGWQRERVGEEGTLQQTFSCIENLEPLGIHCWAKNASILMIQTSKNIYSSSWKRWAWSRCLILTRSVFVLQSKFSNKKLKSSKWKIAIWW